MDKLEHGQLQTSSTPDLSNYDQINDHSTGFFVSDHDYAVFQWIVGACLCQGVLILGIVTNIINIICFKYQGFNDAVNVSFTGLAISDLCSLVTLLGSNIFLTLAFSYEDLSFNAVETQYIITGIPHTTFARISAWITALITLERCLCITVPLKVKHIITSQRVTSIIAGVFVFHLITVIPLYIVCKLEMKWSPEKNKTIFGLVSGYNRDIVEKVSFLVNSVFCSFTSFLIIIICTLILTFKLHSKTQWRKKSMVTQESDILAKRDQKVSKMVVIISLLFIVCFIPMCISFLAMSLVPGLSIDGKHKNILMMAAWIGLVLESINSSVNIFVYYHMSSKYKETFLRLFKSRKCK